ncbi:MAG: hypothetical protein PHT59_02930, partial [Candidatus Omnitrophica bacterium]|nr:hypothetical protein [Candidatus Omnitrophota bacterium]
MRRSRTKRRSRLFLSGVIVLVLLVALVAVNIALGFLKDTLRTITGAYFTQRVTVENILYLPPNFIFLKDVSLTEPGTRTQPEKRILTMPLVMVKFSLLKFARSGRVQVTDICAYSIHSQYAVFRDFVRDNAKQIVKFLLDLPRQDVRFMTRSLRLELAPENGGPGRVDSTLFVKIKNETVFGYGSISKTLQDQAPAIPVDYVFNGFLVKDGISLESLEIMRENFYAKLWGSLHGGMVRTQGFAFINTFFEEHAYVEPYLTFQERAENFLRGFPAPPATGVMPKVDLFILDIESQLDFREFPRVDIQSLKFSLNNNPVTLAGSVVMSWKDPIKLDLDISSRFTRLKDSAQEDLNLKRLDVKLDGYFKDKVYTGDASVQFEFLKKVKSSTPIDAVSTKLSGVNLSFVHYPRVTASVRLADLYCRTDSNEYSFLLPYLSAAVDLGDPKVKFAQFYSGFCDGSITGRARLDMSRT